MSIASEYYEPPSPYFLSRPYDPAGFTCNNDVYSDVGTTWLQTTPISSCFVPDYYQSPMPDAQYEPSCIYCGMYGTCCYHNNPQVPLYSDAAPNPQIAAGNDSIGEFFSDDVSSENADQEHDVNVSFGGEQLVQLTSLSLSDEMPEPMMYFPEEKRDHHHHNHHHQQQQKPPPSPPPQPQKPANKISKQKSNRKSSPKSHTCGLCMMTLASRSEYSLHIKTTHKQSSYQCDICQKSFKQLTTMRTHRRQHTGERPYTCTTCTRTFADHSSFIKHKRIHSNERPYTCLYCDRSFIQSGNCRRHMLCIHGHKH